MERFSINKYGDGKEVRQYYSIVDNDNIKYHLPARAVSLYFYDLHTAQVICGLLNKEWKEFLRNPNGKTESHSQVS